MLTKGTLTQFGYSSSKSDIQRHNALKKAVTHLTYNDVIKKLNAVKILNKNIKPELSKIFNKDMLWVKKTFSS